MPRLSSGDGTHDAGNRAIRRNGVIPRHESVQNQMAVTLICPKCQQNTELRGTLDAYYLTWCPDCERLWRFEIWSLLHAEDPERKMPWATGR
jgi:hypothetical protein